MKRQIANGYDLLLLTEPEKRLEPEVMDYYNGEVVQMIAEKYGYNQMDALRAFVSSKTHEMLENEDYGLTSFGAGGIFEIWESEKVTGDPKNSIYIRGE
ncbi:MAG: hypothetical protein MR868_03945 [Lachnospiraceae bacterium]|nr:hypothetical protein [Lachnospiraceae bacterium]